MKKTLTFIHPQQLRQVAVSVGADGLQVLAGFAASLAALCVALDPELPRVAWPVLGAGIALVHARQWRHLATWPVLASLLLATMSAGMSMLVTGWVINRWIARRYRDARWKVRDVEGELGEYSSRFLAVDELGFRESDMIGGVVRRHLHEGLEPEVIEAAGGAAAKAPARPGRRGRAGRPAAHEVPPSR